MRDALQVGNVRRIIELEAEPLEAVDHLFADRRGVFTDAAREDERVESLQRRNQRAQFTHRPIAKEVDGEFCPCLIRRKERAHVGRDTGHAEKAGLTIEQVLDRARIHFELVLQVQHDAGIKRAGSRSHHQSVERGKAHRCRDARPGLHCAHRCAIAQVRNDDASACRRGVN